LYQKFLDGFSLEVVSWGFEMFLKYQTIKTLGLPYSGGWMENDKDLVEGYMLIKMLMPDDGFCPLMGSGGGVKKEDA
jgi:hypothetical protein